MKTLPRPLPATNDDPAVVAARNAKTAYEGQVAVLRGNSELSDLYRAQKLKAVWQQLLETLRGLDADLTARRIAYLTELQQVVYIGADIPEGTSPADKAVLMQAFTNALDRARAMGADQIQRALADAEKFGDDQSQRAIETAALEKGQIGLVRAHLAAVNPDRLKAFDLLEDAQRAVQRTRVEDGFAWQAFRAPHPPVEAARIGEFEEAQQELARRTNPTFGPRRLGQETRF